MDYGFTHAGRVFTPNGTQGVPAEANDDRNRAIERAELARWAEQPDRMLAYYDFPREGRHTFTPVLNSGYYGQPDPACVHCDKRAADHAEWEADTDRRWRRELYPRLTDAIVSTWLGTEIGTIIAAKVYPHNFGGRFVSLKVRGTNGAVYAGRASWDHGSCVWLRRCKG